MPHLDFQEAFASFLASQKPPDCDADVESSSEEKNEWSDTSGKLKHVFILTTFLPQETRKHVQLK